MGLINAIRKPESSLGRRFSPHKKSDYSAMSNGTGDTEAINSQEDSFDENKFYAALVEREDEEMPASTMQSQIQRDQDGFPVIPSAPDVFLTIPNEGTTSDEVSPLKSPPKTDLQVEEQEVLPTFLSVSVDSIDEDAFLAAFAETEFPPSPQKEESINENVVNDDNNNTADWGAIAHISVISSHSDEEAEILEEAKPEAKPVTKPEPTVPKTTATSNDSKSNVRNLVQNFNTGRKVKNMAAAFEGSKTSAPAPARTYRRPYTPAPAATSTPLVSPETTKNELLVQLKPVNRTNAASSRPSSIKNLIHNFNNGKPTTTTNNSSSNKVQVSFAPTKPSTTVETKETKRTTHVFKHLDENNKVVNRYVSFNNVDSQPKLASFEDFHQDVDLVVSADNSDEVPAALIANSRLELELEPAQLSTSMESSTSTATTVTDNTRANKPSALSTRAIKKQFTSIEESIKLSCEVFNRESSSPDTSFDSALTSPSQCSSVFSVFSVSNAVSRQFADSIKQIKSEFNEFCDDHAALFASAAAKAEKEVEAFLAEPPPRRQR